LKLTILTFLLIVSGILSANQNIKSTKITEYKDGNNIKVKIKYLNFNGLDIEDRKTKDSDLLKEWLNDLNSPLFIAGNVKQTNSLAFIKSPHKIMYTSNNFKDRKKLSKNAIGIGFTTNEYFKIKKATFEDEGNNFKEEQINMFIINKKLFIQCYFTENYYREKSSIPESLLNKIKNLNKVIAWARSEFIIQRKNIIIIGRFGISKQNLEGLVFGFKPIVSNGNEIVKLKSRSKKKKYGLINSENVLIFKESKDTEIEIDYSFKNKLQNKKYAGSKNLNSFTKKVGIYFPINIYIKTKAKKQWHKKN